MMVLASMFMVTVCVIMFVVIAIIKMESTLMIVTNPNIVVGMIMVSVFRQWV